MFIIAFACKTAKWNTILNKTCAETMVSLEGEEKAELLYSVRDFINFHEVFSCLSYFAMYDEFGIIANKELF